MFVRKRAIVWYMFEDSRISSFKVTLEIVAGGNVLEYIFIVDWNGVGLEQTSELFDFCRNLFD